jgi:hypothetical protein
MKRKTRLTRRQFSEDSKPAGNSRYAKKKAAGNQMYGPGCCANKLDVAAAQKRIAEMNRKQSLAESQAA